MSKRFKVTVFALGSSLALWGVACGGDSGSTPNLLPDGAVGGGNTEAGGQPVDDSGGGIATGGGDDSSVTTPPATDSGSLDGSVSVGDGSVALGDGGAITDAAADAPAPPFTGIACGTSVCHVGAEVCCNRAAVTTGRPGTREDVCTTAADCSDAGIPLGCNKPSDCSNGEICCAAYEPRIGAITSVSCAATCLRSDAGTTDHYEVCDVDQSPACHFGGTCLTSLSTPTLNQVNQPLLVCR